MFYVLCFFFHSVTFWNILKTVTAIIFKFANLFNKKQVLVCLQVELDSVFPSLLARNTYAGVRFRTTQSALIVLRKVPNNYDDVRNFSDDYRTFPKISDDFLNNSKKT